MDKFSKYWENKNKYTLELIHWNILLNILYNCGYIDNVSRYFIIHYYYYYL